MKKYEVEFRRTSFVTYTVEANDPMQAQYRAYQEAERDGHYRSSDIQIESIEELNNEDQK